MAKRSLAEEVARIQSMVTSGYPPGLVQDDLVTPIGRPMVKGTAVPALGVNFVQRPSGLVVPADAGNPTAPIDQLLVYLTAEEVLGVAPPLSYVKDELLHTPLGEVLHFVASTLGVVRSPGNDRRQSDRHFARMWFRGPTLTRVENLLRAEDRGLVVPQALFVLAKLASVISPDDVPGNTRRGNLVAALLTVAQHLGQGDALNQTTVSTSPGPLGREIVANQVFNSTPDAAYLMAHFVRRWLQMPVELAGQPRVVHLERIYETATGVPLRDLLAVGAGLLATALAGRSKVEPGYFANLEWSSDRLERALNLIAADRTTLRREVRQEIDRHGVEWAVSTFERYPVVRLLDGGLLVIDPLLLLRRTYGLLPMFDTVDGLRRGSSPDRPLAKRVEGCVRHLAELYTLEVLRSIVGPGQRSRLYDEAALRNVYSRPGTRIADAAIEYGDGWVVVEITTSQLRRESVAGMGDQALEGDLEKLVDKVAQIDSTITALRGDEASLTGVGPLISRQFHPLLIVADGFPVNPITLTVLRARVRNRNLLPHPDTALLEVADVEDLELVEALQEEGGPSLRDLLRAKKHAGLANMGLRDYITVELGRRPTRPRRIEQLYSHALDPALDALRRPGTAA